MTTSDQQGPTPRELTLVETVVACLREDINIPYSLQDRVELRQPPINDDDHDSWASSGSRENWTYVAYGIIETIDRYRERHDK